MRRWGRWLGRGGVGMILWLMGTQTYALPIGQLIQNGELGASSTTVVGEAWTTSGMAAAQRGAASAAPVQGATAPLTSFFANAFQVLGNVVPTGAEAAPEAEKHTFDQTVAQQLSATSETLSVEQLTMNFMLAAVREQANESSTDAHIHDLFIESFNQAEFLSHGTKLATPCPGGVASCGKPLVIGNPWSTPLRGLRPGTSTLKFALDEVFSTVPGTPTTP